MLSQSMSRSPSPPRPNPVRPLPRSSRPHGRCSTCAARSLSVCNAVPSDELHRLEAASASVSFEPGRTFVSEGNPATHLFNITAGVVKLYKLLVDGRRQIVGFLFPGDLLGLSFGGDYAYSAEAVTPVTACCFARPRLNDLLRQFPALSERLLGIAVNELGAAQEQMLLLGRKSARERVASFLLSLSRRAAKSGLGSDPVFVPMTRADIGDYLGVTIETVSRTISQLKREGIVALPSATTIRLADRAALEEMAEGG